MKQSLEILKTYFETGDKPTQNQFEDVFDSLVHRDEFESTENTVFVSVSNGDDTTAEIGNTRKPYLTIDAAIAAFEVVKPREGDLTSLEHPFLNIQLQSEGTYEVNALLPQRNIRFESEEACTIDFSNNTNEYFHDRVDNVYNKFVFYLPKGRLLNNSENKFLGGTLTFEGEFDIIETYGAPYSTFGKGFITVRQANVTYNLLKGSGIAFSTLGTANVNTFKGNIESAGGKLVVNNEGKGINHFDFDEATGTHELMLLKGSLAGLAYINFGKHKPNVTTQIMKIAHTGKVYVNFKENAETNGSFSAGEVHFTGNKVTINASLARLQYKLFFENVLVESVGAICSLINGNAQVYIKNSYIEVPHGLVAIETNTVFSTDSLVFKGHNTIYQTGTPGSNLITKYATANPTNFSSKVELQNSLITNGVLNTVITGNTDSTATVTIGTTNTY
ncbi:hypothetical protein [uncultured Kordia sp.]|uniref:hypothetical protein n=1 Tax=uncultured Kordia sp. TaxID=507699 RepID=UPI00262EBA3A|nr:hypothetical protein [uncultured Kordia sp.]